MAGVSLEITLDDVLTDAMLARVRAAVADLSEPFDDIGDALVTSTKMRFETGTGPDGTDWPVSRAAQRRHGQTLVDRGHLRDSITHVASRTAISVGSNLVYARIHQLGGDIQKYAASMPVYRRQADIQAGISRFARRSQSDFMTYHEVGEHSITMPARPYLGVDDADAAMMVETVEGFLRRALS